MINDYLLEQFITVHVFMKLSTSTALCICASVISSHHLLISHLLVVIAFSHLEIYGITAAAAAASSS